MSEAYGKGPYPGPELDALGTMVNNQDILAYLESENYRLRLENNRLRRAIETMAGICADMQDDERRLGPSGVPNVRRNGKGTDNGT